MTGSAEAQQKGVKEKEEDGTADSMSFHPAHGTAAVGLRSSQATILKTPANNQQIQLDQNHFGASILS